MFSNGLLKNEIDKPIYSGLVLGNGLLRELLMRHILKIKLHWVFCILLDFL